MDLCNVRSNAIWQEWVTQLCSQTMHGVNLLYSWAGSCLISVETMQHGLTRSRGLQSTEYRARYMAAHLRLTSTLVDEDM